MNKSEHLDELIKVVINEFNKVCKSSLRLVNGYNVRGVLKPATTLEEI